MKSPLKSLVFFFFVCRRGFYKIFPFHKGERLHFVCRRGFYKIFLFCKEGTVNFFLYLKEKRLQKRSKPACRWTAGEHGDYVLQSRRSSSQTPALRAELFARRKGVAPLAVLWGAPIVWRLFFWCAYRISAPPETYFSPAKCRKIVPPSLFYEIFAVIFAKLIGG